MRDYFKMHWPGCAGLGGGMVAAGLPYLEQIETTARVVGTVFGALCSIIFFAEAAPPLPELAQGQGPRLMPKPITVDFPFPLKGLNGNWAVARQPKGYTDDALNVMGYDTTRRARGGRRPGLTALNGLSDGQPIQGLYQFTLATGDAGTAAVAATWDLQDAGVYLWTFAGTGAVSLADFSGHAQAYAHATSYFQNMNGLGTADDAATWAERLGDFTCAVNPDATHRAIAFRNDEAMPRSGGTGWAVDSIAPEITVNPQACASGTQVFLTAGAINRLGMDAGEVDGNRYNVTVGLTYLGGDNFQLSLYSTGDETAPDQTYAVDHIGMTGYGASDGWLRLKLELVKIADIAGDTEHGTFVVKASLGMGQYPAADWPIVLAPTTRFTASLGTYRNYENTRPAVWFGVNYMGDLTGTCYFGWFSYDVPVNVVAPTTGQLAGQVARETFLCAVSNGIFYVGATADIEHGIQEIDSGNLQATRKVSIASIADSVYVVDGGNTRVYSYDPITGWSAADLAAAVGKGEVPAGCRIAAVYRGACAWPTMTMAPRTST